MLSVGPLFQIIFAKGAQQANLPNSVALLRTRRERPSRRRAAEKRDELASLHLPAALCRD